MGTWLETLRELTGYYRRSVSMSADPDEQLLKLCKMRYRHLMEARVDTPAVCLCSYTVVDKAPRGLDLGQFFRE